MITFFSVWHNKQSAFAIDNVLAFRYLYFKESLSTGVTVSLVRCCPKKRKTLAMKRSDTLPILHSFITGTNGSCSDIYTVSQKSSHF